MGQLIDDLLAFSQIGRTTMHAADGRSDGDGDGGRRRKRSPPPAARLSCPIAPLPPCHGEPALLNQVFVNLMSNAVKFTAQGAQPDDHDWLDDRTARPVYFVRDNGVGFDERYAEKLFGVFQRLHRTEEFEGTGVGLAIVHRIITRHGGRVWAEGKMNGGATFYFTLPPQLGDTRRCRQGFRRR